MTQKVISMEIPPGIQRDGTQFDAPCYTDGRWVRFQRTRPRKIGGYDAVFLNASGISRGMAMSTVNGFNYVVSGYSGGLEQWITSPVGGVGSGPYKYTLSNFTPDVNNSWQFDIAYDSTGDNTNNLVAHPGQNLTYMTSSTATPVLYGTFPGNSGSLTLSKVGVFTATGATTNGSTIFSLDTGNVRVAAGQSISGTGIPVGATVKSADIGVINFTASCAGTALTTTGSPALVVNMVVTVAGGASLGRVVSGSGNSWVVSIGGVYASQTMVASTTGITLVTMSAAATASGSITATFDNNIAVSGGCVVLHPYLFVYGDNGLIQNSSAGDFANWVSADANANNVSTGKIVKGLPIRGGSTSPSGLFWAVDALIRVSFQPTSAGGQNFYWTYDLVSSQTSIMSSSCVIEYDGIFYWIGVDRFLCYNGAVQEIPNELNQNYFFDNVNIAQRQKVWASKVSRYGEIWWFYPKGTATECTDAIIYNVRNKSWYDAGEAPGARRSAGVFSEVFPKPFWAGNETFSVTFSQALATVNNTTALVLATADNRIILGMTVTGLYIPANTTVTNVAGTTITMSNAATSSGTLTVTFTGKNYKLWQHETGYDAIDLTNVTAIQSYYETNSIGTLGGLVGTQQQPGDNLWTRLERVEPDFVQTGTMTVTVTGQGYADDAVVDSVPYPFDPTTLKIDMREQRREMRLRFESNVAGGTYQTGRVLLSITTGDSRSTGNP